MVHFLIPGKVYTAWSNKTVFAALNSSEQVVDFTKRCLVGYKWIVLDRTACITGMSQIVQHIILDVCLYLFL